MPEMDEYPPEIFVILLDTVIQLLDMSLIQKAQDFFLELTTAFARDDLDKFDLFINCFLHNTVEFCVDLIAAIINVVQIEFELRHYFFFSFEKKSNGGL